MDTITNSVELVRFRRSDDTFTQVIYLRVKSQNGRFWRSNGQLITKNVETKRAIDLPLHRLSNACAKPCSVAANFSKTALI